MSLPKAARNHCDSHRRMSDELHTRQLIAGQNRARENAKEWIRRADQAANAGLHILAARLVEQAKLELRSTPWTVTDEGAIISCRVMFALANIQMNGRLEQ